MRSNSSDQTPSREGKRYFCNEPWVGLFSVETNLDVTFCPCFLKLKLGNLSERSLPELWNAAPLVALRRDFSEGRLPLACTGQLCPVALGTESYLSRVPDGLPPQR